MLFCRPSGFCHLFGMKDEIKSVPIKIYKNVLHSLLRRLLPLLLLLLLLLIIIILCFSPLFLKIESTSSFSSM